MNSSAMLARVKMKDSLTHSSTGGTIRGAGARPPLCRSSRPSGRGRSPGPGGTPRTETRPCAGQCQCLVNCPYRMTCQNFGKANRLGYVKILILFMTKVVDILI